MKNIILAIITAFIIAGCATTKEELKKMPVSQLVPKKIDKPSAMDELPVTQMLEEVKGSKRLRKKAAEKPAAKAAAAEKAAHSADKRGSTGGEVGRK